MSTDPNKETSGTLMMRIQEDPADRGAWDRFVELYQPMIRDWCLRWGSQPADAEDVAQQVLLKLLTAMKNYRRLAGSGFRGWLKTVTHNAWLDFVDSRHNSAQYPGSIDSITDSNDALADLEAEMQRLSKTNCSRWRCAGSKRASSPAHGRPFASPPSKTCKESRPRPDSTWRFQTCSSTSIA